MPNIVSTLYTVASERVSHRVNQLAVDHGLCPQSLKAGLWLWACWSSLTWLTFIGSLGLIEIGEKSDISILEGLIGGGLIGIAQGWALRSHLTRPLRWAGATLVSWGGLTLFQIGALGWIVPHTHQPFIRGLTGLAAGAYVGLGLGVGQWLAIRHQIAVAWRWIPLSSGIWAMGMSIGWSIGGSLRSASNLFISEVFGLMIAWGAIALLSGLAIVGLIYPNAVPTDRPPRFTEQQTRS